METEIVPNTFPAMFWGYAAVWGLLVCYLVSLGIRIKNLERRIQKQGQE